MAQGVTPDGINPSNRVNATTTRNLYRKIVDNVLNGATYMSRLMGSGKPFTDSLFDVSIKVEDSGLGEFFSGLETLASSASDTLVTMSYGHTGFSQPIIDVMLESFSNTGPDAEIDLDVFKFEEAVAEAKERLGTTVYDGTSPQKAFVGLEVQVDDGTNSDTIGGVSRSAYSVLNSTVTDSGGRISFGKLGTLHSSITAAGSATEYPTIGITTKTVWDLYTRLLQPSVRASYNSIGYPALALRGNSISPSRANLKGHAGFTAVAFRDVPIIPDEPCTSGVFYMLNERYIEWRGRTAVPAKYRQYLKKLNLGRSKTMEGVNSEFGIPSDVGWFYQKMQMMQNQAGMIGRLYAIGQIVGKQPRRQGKLTGITSV